jgi:phage terminase large subunit-like protein
MNPAVKCGLLVGGNRSGKTESGAMIAAATALGADDPAVQKWIRDNQIPADSIKKRPGRVCCVSLTSNESKRVQRPKIEKLLPAGTYWKNRHGGGEATALLPNGGVLLFKTVDQGARSFQADAWDLCWFDEDPEDQSVMNEARMRLVDRRGWCLITMTPLRGLTWIWERFVNAQEPGSLCKWIYGCDNPYVPTDELETLLRSYGGHERAARAQGQFTSMEGLIYPFERHVHVVEPFEPPADWPRYAGIDFGTRNPFAYVLAAHDLEDDVLHIYGAHYKKEWTLKQHVSAIKRLNDIEPQWIVADCEDRGSRLALAREHDLPTLPSKKGKGSVRAGLNIVAERLALDANNKPHLVVHDNRSCTPIIREFQAYRWDSRTSRSDQPDAPLKKNDHSMDAIRYLCSRLVQMGTFGAG